MWSIRISDIHIPMDAASTARVERYSNLFSDKLTEDEFTFPIDIPITPTVSKLLAFMEDPHKSIGTSFNYPCHIHDGGIQRYNGLLTLLGRKENIIRASVKMN